MTIATEHDDVSMKNKIDFSLSQINHKKATLCVGGGLGLITLLCQAPAEVEGQGYA